MQKKIIAAILAFTLVLSLALTACGGNNDGGTHTHTWATVWSSDADYHWHKCTDTACTEVSDKAAHNWDSGVILAGDEATASAEGTKTFTCTVCSKTKTESVPKLQPLATALVYGYEIDNAFPINLYEGQTLSGISDEYYAYGDWYADELELYEGAVPEIPAEFAFRSDIPALVEADEGDWADTYAEEFYTYYRYEADNMSYSFTDYAAYDETSIDGYQPNDDYYGIYYCTFKDVLITRIYYYEYTSDTEFECIIIKNGAVSKAYTYSGHTELSDNQIVNQTFIDQYSYNGVMFLYSYVQHMKPDYLKVQLSDGDITSYQYLQAGQQPDYSAFNKPGYTTVYNYSVYSDVDTDTVPFDLAFLNAGKIELYSSFLTEEWSIVYLNDSFIEVNEGDVSQYDFYIYINGRADNFYAIIYYDDGVSQPYSLDIGVMDGVLSWASCYYYDYSDDIHYYYDFVYNAASGTFRTFIREDCFDFDGTITRDVFDVYKTLGYTLYIDVDFFTAEYLSYYYLFGNDFKRANVILPEYVNDSPRWVWEGDKFLEVYSFLFNKGFNEYANGLLPCEYNLSLYGKTVVMIYDDRVLLIDDEGYTFYFYITDDGIYTDENFFDEISGATYTESVEVYSALECYWYFEGESNRSVEFKDILLATGEWEVSDGYTYDDDPHTPYTEVWIYGNICYITYFAADGVATSIQLNRV